MTAKEWKNAVKALPVDDRNLLYLRIKAYKERRRREALARMFKS